MKQKLTKNDSIANEICDINVMLSAFEAILYRHNLWMDYFHRYQKCHLNDEIVGVFTIWKSWAKSRPPKIWSSQAFIWESSDVDYTKWYEVDRDWCSWLDKNIKK